jgi:hypothetical protein
MDGDITYSIDADAGTATFSANTPAGELHLGDMAVTVSLEAARQIKADAEAAGLRVVTFP